MVKGISRQVIVVHAPDPKLFEQAIFILKDGAIGQDGVTDEALLKEAKRIASGPSGHRKGKGSLYGIIWAFGGAVVTGIVWLLSALI